MGRKKDLTGKTFERLTVIKEDHLNTKKNCIYWFCICVCGKQTIVAGTNLRNGRIKSCGCLRDEAAKTTHTTHGKYLSPTHNSWKTAKSRVSNSNLPHYKYYGGRGITMCSEWFNSFDQFLSDMGDRPKGMTLDRINNDGNYEPSNCRWATWKEQANNKRSRRKVVEVNEFK